MPTIWYYKNVRVDGGVRTGIDIDGDRVYHRFVAGDEDETPVLKWFVDVQCTGDSLPTEPESARDWLLANLEAIRGELSRVAEQLVVGLDELSWPYMHSSKLADEDVDLRVRCSAIRRLDGLQIAERLREVANGLEKDVASLPPAELITA